MDFIKYYRQTIIINTERKGNQVISSARRLDHGRGGSRSRSDGVRDSDPRRLGHSRAGLCLTVTA